MSEMAPGPARGMFTDYGARPAFVRGRDAVLAARRHGSAPGHAAQRPFGKPAPHPVSREDPC
jgi:hypothetical protein